jgi:GNAT superfamily N-acetyltransferase
MSVKFRLYKNDEQYGKDYYAIRNFLLKLNSHNYSFGRWDWMVMNIDAYYADPEGLEKIGIWESGGNIVAIATYDTSLGKAYLLVFDEYKYLKGEMLEHARRNLSKQGSFKVLVLDGDIEFQNIVMDNNFYPTQGKENDAVFIISTENTKYVLPNNFKICSLQDNFNVYKYGQCLWKGFNHEMTNEGPFPFYWEKHSKEYEQEWDRPNVDLNLKIFVVAPNGDFVSHCGTWYDKTVDCALVEPVATEPAYRKMGLGKAVVLEAIKRCGKLGAKKAYVSSSQQFYYNIGFRPYTTATWWEERKNE